MKGVILAGGFGNRLKPLTEITNKHLLPIYNKPVIFYPIETLIKSGIREILVVTGPEYAGGFMKLLGSGQKFGCEFYFAVQEEAGGIADALKRAKQFVGKDSVAVILGDNIFENEFFDTVSKFKKGATLFLKKVHDPERFGVAEINDKQKIIRITEKPKSPASPYAVTGFYLYDSEVFTIIETLIPSGRGELEITDVNNHYIERDELQGVFIQGKWTDAGTFESLYEANQIAREIALKNL